MRDLEAKGIIRTSVETTNLAIHLNQSDALEAECVRTFPTVTFPANEVLKREEIENGKTKSGVSILSAVHSSGSAFSRRAYLEAPFDLLYGFRGTSRDLQLLSPYEMLMQYSMEEVKPPNASDPNSRSELTETGLRLKDRCAKSNKKPRYQAGVHYVAIEAPNRVLLPEDVPAVRTLRHRWVWEVRPRPHVPVWSHSKIPRANISPEENARLLSIYMRPWTLNPADASEDNPLLPKFTHFFNTTGSDSTKHVTSHLAKTSSYDRGQRVPYHKRFRTFLCVSMEEIY